MPACGSSEEAACLRGLTATTRGIKQGASPQGPAAYPPHLLRRDFRRRRSQPLSQPLSQQQQQQLQQQARKLVASSSYIWRLLGGLLRISRKIITYSLLGPLVWFSCWLCLGWLVFRVPLAALSWLLRPGVDRPTTATSSSSSSSSGSAKCVLVSGGSSVQAVHLARNLSSSGARVIVCELEGLLGLARFSSACSRYYSVPRPGRHGGAAAYVAALQDIVRRERCTHYVPVSASSPAYFDALAKPHLELLGCECFVPGAQELARLDDPLELLARAERLGLPTPMHRLLDSLDELARLYEDGLLAAAAHYALPAGPAGMRERRALAELRLPASLGQFREQQRPWRSAMNNQRWLLIREPAGVHYVTCTTLRDSRLVANVTCRVLPDDEEARAAGLIPEDRPEVTRWLERFFEAESESTSSRPISGHLSFRLIALEGKPGQLVAIGCRVGVPLAYLCQAPLQASFILRRPCRHRQLLQRRTLCETATATTTTTTTTTTTATATTTSKEGPKPLDKRETLFLIWDPLPYCVYCYLHLPLGRFYEALGARAGCASRGGAIV